MSQFHTGLVVTLTSTAFSLECLVRVLVSSHLVNLDQCDCGRAIVIRYDGGVLPWLEPDKERRFLCVLRSEAARCDLGRVRVCAPIVIRGQRSRAGEQLQCWIGRCRRDTGGSERRPDGTDYHRLGSAGNDEAADQLTLSWSNETAGRDVSHAISKGLLE